MSALSIGRTISAVIEQCLDNCLLVRFTHRSKIFRGVLFDEKHSVVSRTSLYDQNVQAGVTSQNSNYGQTRTRATTRQNDSSNGNGRLYRDASSTRRNNNSSNKLEVFTEFDVDEGANTRGSSARNLQSAVVQKTHDSNSAGTSKDSTNGQRSARSKSRSESGNKANGNNKNISSNLKAVKVQNGSQNLKGKGKDLGKLGESTDSKWSSKLNLKLGQVVSKNSKSAQNSKVSQKKTVSPKQNEVEKAKMSTQKGKLSHKKSVTKTSPSQDSMVVNRKRKLDSSGSQTGNSSKMAKKHQFSNKREISTQTSKGLENNKSKEEITTLTQAGSTDSKQELNLMINLCANREEDIIDNKLPNTNLHPVDNSEKAKLLSCSLVSSAVQEKETLETDSKTEENLPKLNDNGKHDNMKADQTVDISVKESSTLCTTPVKRSARISERRSRRQFSNEMFDKSTWITSQSKSQQRNFGTRTNDITKKSVKHDDTTTDQSNSAKSTVGSTESKPEVIVKSNNNKNIPRAKHTRARIKFTPVLPRISSSKSCTENASKQCHISVGDIVWGKVHGHPWWPGRVLAISGNTVDTGLMNRDAHVAWFGSNTSSIMTCHELAAFSTNFKKRFRRNKRGPYRTAVHEAQEAAGALGGTSS